MVKNQACIGIFVVFTAKRLHLMIKDKGESWTGQYFRGIIFTEHVFPFLKNEENVMHPDEMKLYLSMIKHHVCEQIRPNICFKTMMLNFRLMIFGLEIHLISI